MARTSASRRTIARPVYRSSSFVPYRRRRPYLPVSIPGTTTITHTSPTATLTVSGDTAPGALAITHTSPTADVTVAAGLTNTLSIAHTSPTVTVTVSGDTAPVALTLTHTSPTAALTVSGGPAATALTLTHTSPSAAFTVAAGLNLGGLTLNPASDTPPLRAHGALAPTLGLSALTPVRSLDAKEATLVAT